MADSASITINLRGPIFSGGATPAATRAVVDISNRVGTYALEAWQKNLDGSIRHPTPYYETQTQIESTSITDRSINDRGVVYGPWLEGTGSRNASSRFKGYASLRKAYQTTLRAVPGISGNIIMRLIKELS